MHSFALRLAVRQTLIAVLLLASLFYFTFLLTRRFLWQGLKVVAVSEHTRLITASGSDFFQLPPSDMAARLRQLSPSIPPQFFIEFTLEDYGLLYSTGNLRRQTLADPARTDNVYRINIAGAGKFLVQTFRDGPLTVRIAQNLDASQIVLDAYARAAFALYIAVLALNGFQVWWGARKALRPVRAMQLAAERISSENFGERIAVGPVQDEISALGILLNRTFDRLQASFEQSSRFTADASHELKTPLSVARAQAEKLLRPALDPATQEEAAHGVLAELTQLEDIIEDLLLLARSDAHALPFNSQTLFIRDFWGELLPEVQALAEYHQICVRAPEYGDGRVQADRRWLRHVVLNLVNNAIRHSEEGGALTITSSMVGGTWRIVVEDEGPGVPPEKLERIFGRFYQVRPDEKQVMEGTGLGLAICRSLVHMHGGHIAAENRASGHGLRVTVDLPA